MLALRRQRGQLGGQSSLLAEALLWPVAAHPPLQHRQVLRVLADAFQRNLVGAEGSFDRHAVDLLRPGPALRRAQDDRRPARASRATAGARLLFYRGDPAAGLGEDGSELAMDPAGV